MVLAPGFFWCQFYKKFATIEYFRVRAIIWPADFGNHTFHFRPLSSTANTLNTLYNATEFFYNINVPTNFLSNGYIDCELEIPAQTTSAVDFITNNPLKNLYINLVIVDEDLETTSDTLLAPPINMKNYNVNMPIRPY